jgi:hypothetical protein
MSWGDRERKRVKFQSKHIWNFPKYSLPLRGGRARVRVRVDKIETVWSPLPFIPSHRGEGRFLGELSEKVGERFSDLKCKYLMLV